MARARIQVGSLVAIAIAGAAHAASLASCGRPADAVVSAPMTAALPDAGTEDARAAAEGGSARTRPLPPEPTQPPRSQCRREVVCRPEEDEAPALPFAAPFEKCLPAAGKGQRGQLSVRETRIARDAEPRVCCYVELRDCKAPHGGWP